MVGLAAAGAAILAIISAAGPRGFRLYQKLRQDAISLTAKNASLAAENRKLKREIRQLRENPKAVERAAREDLGMVARDEVVFTFE